MWGMPSATRNLFGEKDGRKRPPSLPRRLDTAVSGKPENAKHRFLDLQKLCGNFWAEFWTTPFCSNSAIVHVGPLPHKNAVKLVSLCGGPSATGNFLERKFLDLQKLYPIS
jgi:hypothetical protein